jgi:hypothetical protein
MFGGNPQTNDAIAHFGALAQSYSGFAAEPLKSSDRLQRNVAASHSKAFQKMGRLRFELRTNRLKAECSTAELATLELMAGLVGTAI